jgi:hypothetical protein
MPGKLLTVAATIQCPHGGSASLSTSNSRVTGSDGAVLLQSDIHTVAGCAFTIGTKPSPCVRIEWQSPALRSSIDGTAPLLESSLGMCYSPESAPQGVAIVSASQQKASGQ